MKHKTAIATILLVFSSTVPALPKTPPGSFTESLMVDSCIFSSTGRNTYFVLEPGYQLTLKGKEDNEAMTLIITVLNETRRIGSVETRVVEERELVNGQAIEVSRNYFAFCKQTSSVFYFGEDVDMYKDGKIISHEGAWIADGKNKAGLMIPGLILLGSRYYQEIAPGVAMDRAEVLSTSTSLTTPVGTFENVLLTEETTPLHPREHEQKFYAPGIGIIRDGTLSLVKYGFVKP